MDTEVIRSRRKTMALQIRDGRVTVRAPLRATDREIRAFVEKHRTWIETHLAKAQARELMKQNVRKLTDAEIRELKEQAKRVIPGRVRLHWNSMFRPLALIALLLLQIEDLFR